MSQDIIEEKQKPDSLEIRLQKSEKADEKIRLCLDFMKEALSQKNDADFKIFWEAKAKCLEIFKKDLSPYIRERLWKEYLEINNQEKSLKKHLDKEASFAKEQINLAIEAIGNDVQNLYQLIAKEDDVIIPNIPLQKDYFSETQKELNLLNVLASRLQSLKKELLSLQIRYREKNLFLKNLSSIADKVYPRRKALIAEISEAFSKDVEEYSKNIFPKALKTNRFYDLKDTIKNFQSIAKVLTLNTSAFSMTRKKLSHLWDEVKKLDDERRKVSLEKKDIFSKNALEIQTKIDSLLKKHTGEEVAEEALLKEIASTLQSMKQLELSPKDVRQLKDTLSKMQDEILGKKEKETAAKALIEQEKLTTLKNEAISLVRDIQPLKKLIEKKDSLKKTISSFSLTKADKELLEDLIASANIYELTDSKDLNASLKEFLGYKKEVKGRIERYRNLLGGSAQDFEKAFIYQELLEKEREHLGEIEKTIEMLEEKALD